MRNECCDCLSSSCVRPPLGTKWCQSRLREATGPIVSQLIQKWWVSTLNFSTVIHRALIFPPIWVIWVAKKRQPEWMRDTHHLQIVCVSVQIHDKRIVSLHLPKYSPYFQVVCEPKILKNEPHFTESCTDLKLLIMINTISITKKKMLPHFT